MKDILVISLMFAWNIPPNNALVDEWDARELFVYAYSCIEGFAPSQDKDFLAYRLALSNSIWGKDNAQLIEATVTTSGAASKEAATTKAIFLRHTDVRVSRAMVQTSELAFPLWIYDAFLGLDGLIDDSTGNLRAVKAGVLVKQFIEGKEASRELINELQSSAESVGGATLQLFQLMEHYGQSSDLTTLQETAILLRHVNTSEQLSFSSADFSRQAVSCAIDALVRQGRYRDAFNVMQRSRDSDVIFRTIGLLSKKLTRPVEMLDWFEPESDLLVTVYVRLLMANTLTDSQKDQLVLDVNKIPTATEQQEELHFAIIFRRNEFFVSIGTLTKDEALAMNRSEIEDVQLSTSTLFEATYSLEIAKQYLIAVERLVGVAGERYLDEFTRITGTLTRSAGVARFHRLFWIWALDTPMPCGPTLNITLSRIRAIIGKDPAFRDLEGLQLAYVIGSNPNTRLMADRAGFFQGVSEPEKCAFIVGILNRYHAVSPLQAAFLDTF